ncbi:MAG: sulfatase-like hydrolase/transferase [Phycisphaeraceae bacterium]
MSEPVRQPNVVIFFTDQQRWDASGLFGNPLELMSNFDRLAREGTWLKHAFTCQPVCGPARACLQAGQYATTNGMWKNSVKPLGDEGPRLAHLFHEAGYRTGYVGKWHLGGPDIGKRAVPREFRCGYQDWLAIETPDLATEPYDCVYYDEHDQPVKLPGYRADATVDAAIRYLGERAKDPTQPFFLMTSLLEPHHQNRTDSYPAPTGYRERYEGRWTPPDLAALPGWNEGDARAGGSAQQQLGGYWGMIKRIDEAFGRMMDALRSLGLEENTIVLFATDHGCHFKTRNSEYKRSCHDSSIRLPAMITGPGFTGGGALEELVSLVDIPPTLLEACGIEVPGEMEGRSILPLIRREGTDWPEEVLVQISEAGIGRAVRTRRWKYGVMADEAAKDEQGGASRYVETHLYDLEHDPYELDNLIGYESHVKLAEAMRGRLLRRMAAIGEAEPEIVSAKPRRSGQRELEERELYL